MVIKKYTKNRIFVWITVIIIGFCSALTYGIVSEPILAAANDAIVGTGYLTYGVTGVRIRTSTDTSNTDNVITMVDGGFQFDIYGTEYTSDSYAWYNVGFNYNGEYMYGYVAAEFVTLNSNSDYTEDTDFEEYLDQQGFPESYKDDLRQLHAQYPKWIFIADHNGVDWDTMVSKQNYNGKSLVPYTFSSAWKSTADGCYDWNTGEYTWFDSGGWVQASSEAVQYALDPRNFLNSTNVFMFESLTYNASLQTESGLRSIISGSFMDGSSHDLSYNGTNYDYSSGLVYAGGVSGVSPYHLATRIIQEQGFYGDSYSITGNFSGYEGYYNYYNQGASMSGNVSAVENGLIYASRYSEFSLRPWNSRMKSIIGGAKNIGDGYINIGQNTLYYEKFDVRNFYHQYMTNILAPKSESITASDGYSEDMRASIGLEFTIPVYNNMPEDVCESPSGDGSPNNKLKSLSIDGYSLTPTFSMYTTDYSLIVSNQVSGVEVSGSAASDTASVSGLGYYNLSVGDNEVNINVTAQNGKVKTYTITIVRKEADTSGDGNGFTTRYRINEINKTISNIAEGSSADDVIDGVICDKGVTVKLLDSNGKEVSGKVSTGNILTVYDSSNFVIASYSILIYGDLTGDGELDVVDIVKIKRYILGMVELNGIYYEAADCNHDTIVDVVDIVAIKRNILGIGQITQ